MMSDAGWVLWMTRLSALCYLGALLCVLGFMSAVIVSTLDKVGMKQLGLEGTIQEESRKVVCAFFVLPFFPFLFCFCPEV